MDDVHPEEEQDEDLGEAPDFFTAPDPSRREHQEANDLDQDRAAARRKALHGEHKIFPSSPTGPGSLAEALNQAFEQDLVDAAFTDDGVGEPYILYRPRQLPGN